MEKLDRDFLSRQFIKLGDMMGDGLHHEPEGKWISKEYKKISNLLYPEISKRRRELINDGIVKFLKDKKCRKCNSELKQSRSGSKVINCTNCSARYKVK